MRKENKKGFTLIELLVVVLIIGILAAIALPQYKRAIYKTKMKQVEIALKEFRQQQILYELKTGSSLPEDNSQFEFEFQNCQLVTTSGSYIIKYMCKYGNSTYYLAIYNSITQASFAAEFGGAECSPYGCYISINSKGFHCRGGSDNGLFRNYCLDKGYDFF